MIQLLLLLISNSAFASPPSPFPVFLKQGFSSVLEFDEAPIRVVMGDSRLFQVEKLDHSLVVRALAPEGMSNLFVYFKNDEPRLFLLRASDEAEPTYYKKFTKPIVPPRIVPVSSIRGSYQPKKRATRLLLSRFDPHKDYLTLDLLISADATAEVKPVWDEIRLKYQNQILIPGKLWAERKEVQRDSQVKARLIFIKPSVPKDLVGVSLHIPLKDNKEAVNLMLRGAQ